MKKIVLLALLFTTTLLLFGCEDITTESYMVAFNPNNGESLTTEIVTEGHIVTEPATPEKEGYVFEGWFSDSTLNSAYDFTQVVNGDITLYAKWGAVIYTAMLYSNGVLIDEQEVTIEDSVVLIDPDPVEGHHFGGWDIYNPEFSTTDPYTATIKYDVIWIIDDFTLKFVDNELIVLYEEEFEYDTDLTSITPPTAPTITGYTFIGWEPVLPDNMPGEDLTLIAHYEPIEYTVTYMVNGSLYQEYTVGYEEDIPQPDDPILSGYAFTGWTPSDVITMPNEDVTFYAEFEEASSSTVLDAFPTEDVEISFWHIYGYQKAELIQQFIDEFEAIHPNVTINSLSQGSYDDLNNKVKLAIVAGVEPTITLGYSSHFMEYMAADALVPLNDFMEDEQFGIDTSDIIPTYLSEGYLEDSGLYMSFPFSKSTEVMIYNKTLMDAAGVTIPSDHALTYAELETIYNSATWDCDYFINFDSAANLFITSTYMFGVPYTNQQGEVLFNTSNASGMLSYYQSAFDSQFMALPLVWNQSYGSYNFTQQDVCMTVGSTAGIMYNIPDGTFEVGMAPVPQYDLASPSAISQGPSIGILSNTTDAERLVAWEFIKYLTNTENTAEWSLLTGYLPVRESAWDAEVIQDAMATPNSNYDYYYTGLMYHAVYNQLDYMTLEPGFVGAYTSSDVRTQVGYAMEMILAGYSPAQVIEEAYYQLGLD